MKSYFYILFCLLLVSCGNEMKTISNSSILGSEDIDDGITNQAAKINCDLYLNSSTIPYRKISTISSTDTFTDNAKQGDVIKFDCSQTQDEDAVSQLSFSLDSDYQPAAPNFVNLAGGIFTYNASQVGRFPMALKVVDSHGKERIKTFTLVVECLNQVIPTLDTSKISITATGKLNYFNYAVDPSGVSGGTGFQYAWDFNGDSVFDPFSLATPNDIWTSSSTLNNIYSIFVTEGAETRKISVKVKNNCEYERSYTINAHFPSDNIPRTAASKAVVKPYFYLQADISSANVNDQRTNGDLLVTQYPEDTALRRIECDYKKTRIDQPAIFTMKAYNYYKQLSTFQHGMEIQVQNINDLLTTGTQEILGATLNVARYKVSEADDGMIQEIYDRNSNCTIAIRIIRDVGITPCAADQRNYADYKETAAITILGEFSCPSLRDANTLETTQVNNGKFFCQVAPVNQCVGGGGGGGGNPPPEQ